MNSIGHIVYGVMLSEEMEERLSELDFDAEDVGFESVYHGNAPRNSAYLGVLIKKFDERTWDYSDI